MSSYKTCAVPMCKNTTVKTPVKLFIQVPRSAKRRKQWITLARRNPKLTSINSQIFFCEDHFDLPRDMENYMQYKIMGSVSKIRMKPNCLPSKFECQPDRLRRTSAPKPRSVIIKKQHRDVIESILKETKLPPLLHSSNISLTKAGINKISKYKDPATQICFDRNNSKVHVSIKSEYRRKEQTLTQTRNKNMSPMKIPMTTSISMICRAQKQTLPNKKSQEASLTASMYLAQPQLKQNFSHSKPLLSESCDKESEHELSCIEKKIGIDNQRRNSLEYTTQLITTNPKSYIVVPVDCHYLTAILQKEIKISVAYIILCLKKIRQNTTFFELGEEFGLSSGNAAKIFTEHLPCIGSASRSFIYKSNKTAEKSNLPMASMHKDNSIYIIDCLEIEIQKPSEVVYQASTWSEYKKANTVKYLISYTPDGLINYVSSGYGGRISDVMLVESCNFLKCLEPGVSVLAYRGFTHLEQALTKKGFNFQRLAYVSPEAKLSKEIASLKIPKDLVFKSLHEFAILKPQSVVTGRLFQYLDDCVVIACSLINVQNSIINNT